jgi:hypothetical protein
MGDSRLWEQDGRNLVILGHKTPIGRELLAMAQAALMDAAEGAGEEIEIEDVPEKFEVEEWEKEAKKLARAATKRAKAAVLDALSYEIAASDTIQALLCRKVDEWLDPEAFLKKLRDHLWQNGGGIGYSHSIADETEEAAAMLDRAGIGRAVLWESEIERLTAAAMLVLTWWYDRRQWATGLHHLKEVRDKLQPVREEYDRHRHEPDLVTWSHELDRAWRDVQSKLEAVEGEETAVAEDDDETAGELADSEFCADCNGEFELDDEFELVDSVTCSCGLVLCEDCYIEREHFEHDTNEANADLRSLVSTGEDGSE